MPRATSDVKKALLKKGFREDVGRNRDHHYYFLYIDDDRKLIFTKISRGSHKDIDDNLLNQMKKQIKLPKKQFNEYLNCTFSEEEYINYLQENNLLQTSK